MLESGVGAVGYLVRKLNQVNESVDVPESRFDSGLPPALPAVLAIADAAPHLNILRNSLSIVQLLPPKS